jgi:NAD(P)-dependent dehydrogenase (short-subunit alcohol dehydrogenase family)
MGRLDSKTAIITGAGDGIGRATAILFAKEGAEVLVSDRDEDKGKETLNIIRESGGEASFVKADVSKEEDVKNMVDAAVNNYGKLNVLFNNAGITGTFTNTTELTSENFDTVMSINLKGVWYGMKYAVPAMLKAGGGSIINSASIAADIALRYHSHYAATKGGVESMSRVTALEYAPQNIRVNCISPGFVMTPMCESALSASPEVHKRSLAGIPRGRFGTPNEVAYLVLFLASDESSLIIGQVITADGGIAIDSNVGP